MGSSDEITLTDTWRVPEARTFFLNVWPMYVHEISGFDTDFYRLDAFGRWLPDIVDHWTAPVTPPANLRSSRAEHDPLQPFQRAHVITCGGRPVGFVCVGLQPFAYMPEDADLTISEFFLIHASRGTGTGQQAVELLLRRYTGRWQLRAIHDNARAIRFWRKALPAAGVRELRERPVDGDLVWSFVTGA